MAEKFQYFDGKKFTRDENTGYYLCSSMNQKGIRKRMHVYIWEYYNGAVPEKCQVHHIDEDKSNNCIDNLSLMSASEHSSFHGKEKAQLSYEAMCKNLKENAVPKSKEWHSSPEGKKWHLKHYQLIKDKLFLKKDFTCQYCGKDFKSTTVTSKFCSNNCKSAWRRKSGVDDIIKTCQRCGKNYTSNKYQKTKYCSLCKHKRD